VKVKCVVLNDDGNKVSSEMGYVVLHVKDAFMLRSAEEVDATKAVLMMNGIIICGSEAECF
jgi:hypothetical protein